MRKTWYILGVLETPQDYEKALRDWSYKPRLCECGKPLPPHRHKCNDCRKPPMPKGCMDCGADKEGGKMFCPKCAIKRIRAKNNNYKKAKTG
jgi:hypothetical protein